jgi:hypothetical protein
MAVSWALVFATAPAGRAQSGGDVSGAELRSLAGRAEHDETALARLRRVQRVDGTPVDMDAALGDARGPGLAGRLRVLATPPEGTPANPGDARREAARIVDQPRYKPPAQPRPLRGFFRWVGARVAPLGRFLRPLGRPFAWLFRTVTGSWTWSLLTGGVVVGLALFISLRLTRRRGRGLAMGGGRHRDRTRGLDPDQLERDADAAEAAGHYDAAFRLRFLAGLVRLDRAGVVELRPSLTSGGLRRQVPSTSLRTLSLRFDEIVYGGRAAGPDDVETARREWPRTLEEVGR